MLIDIFQYSFMIKAFIAGVVIAISAPLVGHFLVIRKFSLMADTLSHIALTGVAIGLLTRTQPMILTLAITALSAILIEQLRTKNKLPGDAILAMFLPGGLALSVVLLSLADGFNTNIFSYLFGSIVTVKTSELWLTGILGVITILITILFHQKLLFTALDEDSAKISGVKTGTINTILMLLTAITISLSIRIVGALLIGALMIIPVISAMQVAKSFFQSLIISIFVALFAVIIGLFLAFIFNLPAGGVIVLLSLSEFLFFYTTKRLSIF